MARKSPLMVTVGAHQRAMPQRPPPMPDPSDPASMAGLPMVPGAMGPSMSMGPEVTGRSPAVFRPHRQRSKPYA